MAGGAPSKKRQFQGLQIPPAYMYLCKTCGTEWSTEKEAQKQCPACKSSEVKKTGRVSTI